MDRTADTASWMQIFLPWVEALKGYLPVLLASLGLLLAGWLIALLLRGLTGRLLGGMYRLVKNRRLRDEMKETGVEQMAPEWIARLVFWIVFSLFIVAAIEKMGLPVLSNLLSGFAFYLPNLLAAVLIVLVGILAGHIARGAVAKVSASAGVAQWELLGRFAQASIVLVAILVGVDQVGIEIQFLVAVVVILIGSVVGGMALAFGLGARTLVGNLLASHYLGQIYRIGQTVEIDGVRGRILEWTPTAVILDTAEGRTMIPAGQFGDRRSVLITERA
jgi:Mechanosensitive ion channel, conserved TM helix